MARKLGALLLACTLLYVYPRTSVLGAILLTGYLGGAVAVRELIVPPRRPSQGIGFLADIK